MAAAAHNDPASGTGVQRLVSNTCTYVSSSVSSKQGGQTSDRFCLSSSHFGVHLLGVLPCQALTNLQIAATESSSNSSNNLHSTKGGLHTRHLQTACVQLDVLQPTAFAYFCPH